MPLVTILTVQNRVVDLDNGLSFLNGDFQMASPAILVEQSVPQFHTGHIIHNRER
jgi:hypothetical protein